MQQDSPEAAVIPEPGRDGARAEKPPALAAPPRPARKLSTWGLLRAASVNSVSALDEELYRELVVPRRYLLQHVLFVSDPAGIREVLVDKFDNFPRMSSIRRLFAVELGTGTLASEGETWRRHRRAAAPTMDPRAVLADVPALLAIAEAIADELDAALDGSPADLEAWMARLSLQLWNAVVSGGDPEAMAIVQWLQKVPRRPQLLDLVPRPAWADALPSRRARRAEVAHLDDRLRAMIAARQDPGYGGPQDLLARLSNFRDRRTGNGLPPEEVRDEAASLIAGGAATVRALAWVWYLLALHPDVERRLHAELDASTGHPADLGELTYARQVIDETLRLYPPIPAILRQARSADTICDRPVPKDGVVAVIPWVVHRHRRLWPEPDRFDPERFGPQVRGGRPRLAYLPFATGPRTCVGASFALTHMLLVLSVFGRRFRFRLASREPIRPIGRITLLPEGGLPVTVERRAR